MFKFVAKLKSEGLCYMIEVDVLCVMVLLSKYLIRFVVVFIMNEVEVWYWLLSREDVVFLYVVEDEKTNKIIDFVSFYNLLL